MTSFHPSATKSSNDVAILSSSLRLTLSFRLLEERHDGMIFAPIPGKGLENSRLTYYFHAALGGGETGAATALAGSII